MDKTLGAWIVGVFCARGGFRIYMRGRTSSGARKHNLQGRVWVPPTHYKMVQMLQQELGGQIVRPSGRRGDFTVGWVVDRRDDVESLIDILQSHWELLPKTVKTQIEIAERFLATALPRGRTCPESREEIYVKRDELYQEMKRVRERGGRGDQGVER